MLKRVEITGFKSFADVTNIEFGKGITDTGKEHVWKRR